MHVVIHVPYCTVGAGNDGLEKSAWGMGLWDASPRKGNMSEESIEHANLCNVSVRWCIRKETGAIVHAIQTVGI